MQENLKNQLAAAYDADAQRRGSSDFREDWKLKQRDRFAQVIKAEGKKSLLEIGAGDGFDASYFQYQGFEVLATDLSPKMVEECERRGLSARVADVYSLDKLGRTFGAVYSMNVLLHVPQKDLLLVLKNVRDALNDDGLFFLGLYGGVEREEVKSDSNMMNMPRFFSFVSDATLKGIVSSVFEIVSFEVVRPENFNVGGKEPGFHFQALTLRKSRQ